MDGQRGTAAHDAVILAGGRARRLDGIAKPLLRHGRTTLLGHALAAASRAERTVVVGPPALASGLRGVELVREDPPFGGPVAALAAALPRLERPGAPEWLLLLAGDLVDPGPAVTQLLEAAASADTAVDSLLAVDADGRAQQLLGVHRLGPLVDAVRLLGRPDDASVRALLRPLSVVLLAVPPGSTDDVDDVDDARAHGIDVPSPGAE